MTKTILVADDSKTIQETVRLTFEKTGFEVVIASNGAETLDRAPHVQPDVVLADLSMPDADGYAVCSTLKQQATTAHIPVLLLSHRGQPADPDKLLQAQADGHLDKPFDSGELIRRVKELTGVPLDSDMPQSFAATLAQRQAEQNSPPPQVPSPPHASISLDIEPAAAEPAASPAASPFAAPRAEAPLAPPEPAPTPEPLELDAADVEPVEIDSDLPVEEEVVEEIEVVDTGDAIEMEDPIEVDPLAAAAAGPSLEPPAPPEPGEAAPNVDVWALADGGESGEAIEEFAIEDVSAPSPEQATRDVHVDQPTRDMSRMVGEASPPAASAPEALAAAAAPAVAEAAAAAVPGLDRPALEAMAREIIERIAWEVVPELAETIIKEELARLTAED